MGLKGAASVLDQVSGPLPGHHSPPAPSHLGPLAAGAGPSAQAPGRRRTGAFPAESENTILLFSRMENQTDHFPLVFVL